MKRARARGVKSVSVIFSPAMSAAPPLSKKWWTGARTWTREATRCRWPGSPEQDQRPTRSLSTSLKQYFLDNMTLRVATHLHSSCVGRSDCGGVGGSADDGRYGDGGGGGGGSGRGHHLHGRHRGRRGGWQHLVGDVLNRDLVGELKQPNRNLYDYSSMAVAKYHNRIV